VSGGGIRLRFRQIGLATARRGWGVRGRYAPRWPETGVGNGHTSTNQHSTCPKKLDEISGLVALAPRLRVRAEAQGCRPGPGGWKAFCGITLAAHGLLIASWRVWGGGHCWGSRLLTDILPLIGLLCVPAVAALWSSPRLRSVVLALGLLGSITHLPCVYSNAASWNMIADHDRDYWSWSRAPFFYRPRPTPGQRPGL